MPLHTDLPPNRSAAVCRRFDEVIKELAGKRGGKDTIIDARKSVTLGWIKRTVTEI